MLIFAVLIVGIFFFVMFALSWLFPLFLGAVIITLANILIKAFYDRFAPLWWNILAVAVTIFSSVLFYNGIFSDSSDYGFESIIYLLIFGAVSILFICIFSYLDSKFDFFCPFQKNKTNKKTDNMPKETASNSFDITSRKFEEVMEDYSALDYDAVYTYCQVSFESFGRRYYYRTRNPQLKVGDLVYVPVDGGRYTIGEIVSMCDYIGRYAPYPLEKTKCILGKISDKRFF